jgi:hypothetical protein
MKGATTANCRFCQIQVGNRRPAASMDESRASMGLDRSQPRPRISPLLPSSVASPSPTVNRYRRPLRTRTRPRHFDSSPDLDVSRRCEKTVHVPLKTIRDFIDPQGRQHAICNECRRNNERPPASRIAQSPEADENRTRQRIQIPSQSISARQPLQDVTGRHVNRPPPINRPSSNIQARFVPPLMY